MRVSLSARAEISSVQLLIDQNADLKKMPSKRRKARVLYLLKQGISPFKILKDSEGRDPIQYWAVAHYLMDHNLIKDALKVFKWWRNQIGYKAREQQYIPFIDMLRKERMPILAQNLFNEMKYEGIQPGLSTMSILMLCYAESGVFNQAQVIWNEIAKCGFQPDTATCTEMIHAYGRMGLLDEVAKIFKDMKSMGCFLDARVYTELMTCYAKGTQLGMMENVLEEMLSTEFQVDSSTANVIIQSYSFAGSLTKMEETYRRLKACGIFIEEQTIRAIASAYIKNENFYQLGEFVRDVGLRRRSAGNLLWNMLLLSYAANFKMRSLQSEFLNMLEAGFQPDLTTFNIRALAFSRMQMFWDLHITVLHMRHMNTAPDIVTFGAIVDAYLGGRKVKKLSYALGEIEMNNLYPTELTDPLVYEAFGKGDFHASSENLVQHWDQKYPGKCTYSKLLSIYLKKDCYINYCTTGSHCWFYAGD
ncbi:hypothetical protein SUGI_0126900 [Cryptomeria japonica]|nr:hypothetical protein SUGI_0126900 [Cryptomeria japonica]